MQRGVGNLAGVVLVGVFLYGGGLAEQANSSRHAVDAGRAVYTDELQRSTRVFTFQQAASEGPARGQEIYYYSCWMCHNSYTVAAGTPAPLLEDLHDRSSMMMSGKPVTDANIADKIRNGGALMPAFRHHLSNADIADLVSYIGSGECCLASGGVNLPANPWYIASKDNGMKFDYRGNLNGGPTGKVRSIDAVPLEGIMVQLIASDNNIRTTVYSNEAGEYEFPTLPTGKYTLRIARPLRSRSGIEAPVSRRRASAFWRAIHNLRTAPALSSLRSNSLATMRWGMPSSAVLSTTSLISAWR